MKRLGLSLVLALSPLCAAQTVMVTTTADKVDFTGAKMVADLPGPDGVVSMREACIAANNTPGPQTIGFQIPVSGWGSSTTGPILINATTSFPVTTDDITIDGTTQTAFTGDTNPNGAEVRFHSTTTDVVLIQTGIFSISSDHNHILGLGDMDGRNYGLDFQSTAEDNTVTACVIKGVFAAVRVQGDSNVIGSTIPGQGNRLSSLADGLRIQGLGASSADDNVAIGNELTGEFNGVQIAGNATNNRIGGFAPGEANLISGAGYLQEDGTPDGAMVRIEVGATANLILGNLIGTDATGTSAHPNNVGDVGVEIYGDGNIVRGNVIGGITGVAGFLSVQAGVSLREDAQDNVIEGNWIGVDKTGAIAIPNRIGVQIAPFDASLPAPLGNRIGGLGVGEGNVIAGNEEGGVVVALTAAGNSIRGNEIRDNHAPSAPGGLAIDLGADGATLNDHGDVDAGPNDLMNFPSVTSAVGSSQGTVVLGRLDSPAAATAQLDLYSNPVPPAGEVAEAQTHLGTATPDADGTFELVLPTDVTGLVLTATATDAAGNTSEVSPGVTVLPSPWTDLSSGKPGTHGVPLLVGGGPLTPASPIALLLSGAKESTSGFWIAGATAVNLPLLAGTLVPAPTVLIPLSTDPAGSAELTGTWPGAAPGTTLFVQVWLADAGGLFGSAASNAVRGTVP